MAFCFLVDWYFIKCIISFLYRVACKSFKYRVSHFSIESVKEGKGLSSNTYLTVKALTKYIKRKFDADPHLREVYVKGELSNVKIHTTGHIYFTLKDESSKITAAMFKQHASKLKFKPEDGMQVYIRGDVNVFEMAGNYQLYAQSMEPDGIGGLFVAYNQLKEKLEKEGLFNPRWKQALPKFPQKVGVITATTGAAIRDICTTIQRRYPLAEICIYPALVQGVNAAPDIVRKIQFANELAEADVLIVGRGGGSIEDLWAFNEEIVARAIFESRIPIISAVGHETDTTIADYVADYRAATPTAAAEIAVPNQHELYQQVLTNQTRLHQQISNRLHFERNRLTKLQQSYPLATPERLYRPFTERLLQLDVQLQNTMKYVMIQKKNEQQQLMHRLASQSPKYRLEILKKQLEQQTNQLSRAIQLQLQQNKQVFTNTVRTLEILNPLAIMSKGFTVTYQNDKMVKSVEQLKEADQINVQFVDGLVSAKISTIKKKGEY